MKLLPTVEGIMTRRVLVNYRIDADTVRSLVPQPLEPILVEGHGMVGICLIRLERLRPRRQPAALGVSSDNAAHRIAVRDPQGRSAVYVPRRDTSSLVNALLGGRLFPGAHHRARFEAWDRAGSVSISMESRSGDTAVEIRGVDAERLTPGSVFTDLNTASHFYEQGAIGYSPTGRDSDLEALELQTTNWRVRPLMVARVRSSYFEALRATGATVEFDNALVMRGIHHRWHALPGLRRPPVGSDRGRSPAH